MPPSSHLFKCIIAKDLTKQREKKKKKTENEDKVPERV